MILSIVVPYYNVGEFSRNLLENFLELNSLNEDIEFIFIENASTDNTRELLRKYVKSLNNVQLIENNSNKGLSEARNQGLSVARGQWVHFIDGDDYFDISSYAILIEKLKNEKNNVDAIFFGYESVDIYGNILKHGIQMKYDDEIINNCELINRIINGKISNYAWGFVSRKAIWEEQSILFPVNRTFEDVATLYKISESFKDVEFVSLIIMKYVQRKNSITHIPTFKQVNDLEIIIEEMLTDDFLSSSDKKKWTIFLNIMQYQILTLLLNSDEYVASKKTSIKKYLKNNIKKDIGKELFLKNIVIQIGLYDWLYPIIHRYRR